MKMKVNRALWEYYSMSDYQADVNFFTFNGYDFFEKCNNVIPALYEDSPEDMIFAEGLPAYLKDIHDTFDGQEIPSFKNGDEFYNFIEKMSLYRFDGLNEDGSLIRDETNLSIHVEDIRTKCSLIPAISIYLYSRNGWFFPLFYCERHDLFEKYCDLLNIDIPDRPAENDYVAAVKYYFEICETVNSFKETNGFSDEEMVAVIYGFARLLEDTPEEMETSNLPQPRRVWITCAGFPGKGKNQEDFKTADNFIDGVEYWSCNKLTNPGDVVVLYCVSPRSYIHSIWRAVEAPHMSPFSYRKVRVAIGHKVDVPRITMKELREDSYMSNCYVVRKKLMGTHGDELSPNDYECLLRMIEERGGDTSKLPRFTHPEAMDGIEIACEQDVSDKLVVPFLHKLGYQASDYKAELYLQLGRVNREADNHISKKAGRPDFTI